MAASAGALCKVRFMARVVQKFGGTSVADVERIRKAAEKTKAEVDAGNEVAVVVSAMAGVTNQLVEYVGEIKTWGSDDSDAMESYARSLVADLEAFVEGRPLP